MSVPMIAGPRAMRSRRFLDALKAQLGSLPDDLHVSRMFSSLVAISAGEVIGITEPSMEYCPLAASLYGRRSLPESGDVVTGICRSVGHKCREFGYYTGRRELCTHRLAIPFGASEMMMRAVEAGVISAAVVACEGAGTVVAPSPELIQGIGARMNGLFYTSPIEATISGITEAGGTVVFPGSARIDQLEGLRVALAEGYRELAVTVNAFEGESLEDVRRLARESGADVLILGVCTTGIDEDRATELADKADLVWACASEEVRQVCGGTARIQVTTKIPVFVMTEYGVRFLSAYSTRPRVILETDPALQYLISRTVQGQAVTLGKVPTRIAEVAHLPVASADSPRMRPLEDGLR